MTSEQHDGTSEQHDGPAQGPHGHPTPAEVWAAELRGDAAARSRSEQAWHARLGGEEATFAGVLADFGARGRPVVVDLVGGRRHRGWVRVVGADVAVLRTAAGPTSWADVVVALVAVAAVRAAPGAHDEAGSGPVTATATLSAVLATLAGTGVEVALLTSGAEPIVGEIESVGHDVVVSRLTGRGGRVYVRLGSLVEVAVPESG
jgi:hypothetical protein